MLFFDDILVYSASVEDQKHNLRQLFEILRKHKLFAKRSKCSIGRDTVDFAGHTVSPNGISMQTRLTDAITDWPTPTSTREVQQFVVHIISVC